MNKVYIIGIGQIPVGKYPDKTECALASAAIECALTDTPIERSKISMLTVGTMLSGILGNQQQLAALIADEVDLRGIETLTIDSACGSGGAAARVGFMGVAGGFHEAALVCGVERMTHVSTKVATEALATASDWEREGSLGQTFISLNAHLMASYMDAYNVEQGDFAHFSVTAHKNAMTNSNAFLKKKVDVDTYLQSRVLFEPIRLMDAPPICDGAAALIFANEALAKQAVALGYPVTQVLASSIGTDSLSLAKRCEKLWLKGAYLSAKRAYDQSGLSPSDVDAFELHDAYTIITALSLEAAGFAQKGQGVHFGKDGAIERHGKLPISTMGGLKARGHPVGATGVYQLVEMTLQLTDRAGDNQIERLRHAMVQNVGGTGATVITHILARCV